MSDYKESSLTGNKWQRAHTVNIYNSYGGIPWVKFVEEIITNLSDGQILHSPVGELQAEFTDPTTTFNLVSPVDNETIVGSATYGELHVMLHSLYFHLASIRDSQV
jgi:hypothetical protein